MTDRMDEADLRRMGTLAADCAYDDKCRGCESDEYDGDGERIHCANGCVVAFVHTLCREVRAIRADLDEVKAQRDAAIRAHVEIVSAERRDALIAIARAADGYMVARCDSYPQVQMTGALREKWDALVRAMEDDRVIELLDAEDAGMEVPK